MTHRIRRIPCPDGVPLKRIHEVQCLCGHKFHVDLGFKWKEGAVIRCPECGTKLGEATRVLNGVWVIE